jgi:four helix bundle protein
VNKYCSLVAWQAAHSFVISTYRITDEHYHPRFRALFDQLRRAALSIEANIVEGYALDTTPQFLRHLRIARASAAESECILRIIREREYLDTAIVRTLEEQVELALKALRGLIRSLGK